VGSGTAWIFTNGRGIKGTWKKTGTTKPTRFYDANGEPVTLTAGQTFIQVLPKGSKISIVEGSDEPPPSPSPDASAGADASSTPAP
jgi:hypothetical protein